MNKSILKHEIRSMKWMALLSILSSLILAIMFSISLENSYRMMFSNKMLVNEAVIQNALRNITGTAIVAFTILSITFSPTPFIPDKPNLIALPDSIVK